ncbi:MAG: endonuclease V [Methanomassiliicoccales archaeon]|nr:endonuclease V [Methanomassiliicoccales archaeon]
MDLNALIFEAASQIPRGMVSTYGDIARALGDVRASRAVGTVLAGNFPRPMVVPCHRVIYRDGRTGWYAGYGKGAERKTELLRSEGLRIVDGRVEDFERVHFKAFKVPSVLTGLAEEQERLRALVSENDDFSGPEYVAGLDVAYKGITGYSSLVKMRLKDLKVVEVRDHVAETKFPYIPSFLSYREMPLLRPLITGDERTVYLIDGQGRLHPRGFGIACHVGVCLAVPTVGAAKSLLQGKVEGEGRRAPVILNDDLSGYRLHPDGRTKTYVSVGHRVSLESAADLCERLMIKGVPEPLRLAHMRCGELARKGMEESGGACAS